jgi:hypothetical protein
VILASWRAFEVECGIRAESEHKPWLPERVGRSAQRAGNLVRAKRRGRRRVPGARRRVKQRVPRVRRRGRPARKRPRPARRPNGLRHAKRQPARRLRRRLPVNRQRAKRRLGRLPPPSQSLHRSQQRPHPRRWRRDRPHRRRWRSRRGRWLRLRRVWVAAASRRAPQIQWEAAAVRRLAHHVRRRRQARARRASPIGLRGHATTTTCRRCEGEAAIGVLSLQTSKAIGRGASRLETMSRDEVTISKRFVVRFTT